MVNNLKIEYDIDRIGNVSGHLDIVLYDCSFVAKLSWKKRLFFEKIFVFFTKYTLFAENNVFIWGKSFMIKNFFYWKQTFFTENNINETVKNIYLISKLYFYTENVCVTNKI